MAWTLERDKKATDETTVKPRVRKKTLIRAKEAKQTERHKETRMKTEVEGEVVRSRNT